MNKTIHNLMLKIIKSILIFILIAQTIVIPNMLTVSANNNQGVSDPTTHHTFLERMELQGALNSKDGKVWVDKSVSSIAAQVERLNEQSKQDFMVTYSALAKSSSIIDLRDEPIDVVFVIDLSGSMFCEPYGGYLDPEKKDTRSRLSATIEALNASIDAVLSDHSENRVSVVGFGKWAQTILELDRYQKGDDGKYLSLSREEITYYSTTNVILNTATGKKLTLNVNNKGNNNNIATSTNIQQGMFEGLSILNNEENAEGKKPIAFFLGDGAPYSSFDGGNWWEPVDPWNDTQKQIGSEYMAVHVLRAMLTSAYMKQQVEETYGTDLEIYTIGMGLEEQGSYLEFEAAGLSLNPKVTWSHDNAMVNTVKTLWEHYNDGISELVWKDPLSDKVVTSLVNKREESLNIIDSINDYYAVNNYDDCLNVFQHITDLITNKTNATVPTQVEGDIDTSGYLTYEDIIGDYMHVKDIAYVNYNNQEFIEKTVLKSENKTTYVFTGTVDSGIYKDSDLSKLIIEVSYDNVTARETVVIKTPASLIPVIVDDIKIKEDGTKELLASHAMDPLQVGYIVGLNEDILDNNGLVDHSKIDNEYLKLNTDETGEIKFYTNYFSGVEVNNQMVGNTYNYFTPNQDNGFYRTRAFTQYEKEDNRTNTANLVSANFVQDGIVKTPLGNNGYLIDLLAEEVPVKDVLHSETNISIDDMYVQIGQTLTYEIFWSAPAGGSVSIIDTIPQYTTYVSNSVSANGSYDNGVVSWNLGQQDPGASGTVSFQVVVNDDAISQTVENTAQVVVGENQQTTNTTTNPVTSLIIDLEGSKILNGRDMLEGEEFTFNLIANDETTAAAISLGMIRLPNSIASVTNNIDGVANQFVFEGLQFNQVGTYSFKITETQGGGNGLTFDQSTHIVTVEVSQNEQGQLIETITYPEGGVVFTNTYVEPEIESARIFLGADKLFTGRDMFDEESFNFLLQAGDAITQEAIASGDIKLSNDRASISGLKDDEIGSFVFGEMEFTTEGTYVFHVFEEKGDDLDITYDENILEIIVEITLDGNVLREMVTYQGVALFINTYTQPEEPPVEPEVPPVTPEEPPVEPEVPPVTPEEPPVEPEVPPVTPEEPPVEPEVPPVTPEEPPVEPEVPPMTPETPKEDTELPPGTGSQSMFVFYSGLMLLMSGFLIALIKVRKKEEL